MLITKTFYLKQSTIVAKYVAFCEATTLQLWIFYVYEIIEHGKTALVHGSIEKTDSGSMVKTENEITEKTDCGFTEKTYCLST
jgi:hypothetical protein